MEKVTFEVMTLQCCICEAVYNMVHYSMVFNLDLSWSVDGLKKKLYAYKKYVDDAERTIEQFFKDCFLYICIYLNGYGFCLGSQQ